MGALAGARVACHLGGLLLFGGCFPAGAQLGALVAVAALPLLGREPGGASRQGIARQRRGDFQSSGRPGTPSPSGRSTDRRW